MHWGLRYAYFYREADGSRVVQGFSTGDDCGPRFEHVLMRERGDAIEIWTEDVGNDWAVDPAPEFRIQPRHVHPAHIIPPLPHSATPFELRRS
jgi:hypothetical protein